MLNEFEVRGSSKSFNTKKKPLTSKSFKTKRNLSPQNHSTQKETSHLKIIEVRDLFCVD
jgi:hypothetical protein